MKTTVNVANGLYEEARRVAEEEGVPLKELIEAGLRHEVERRSRPAKPFRLRDASVGGEGPQPGVDISDRETWHPLIYGGRGGR
jgi:hypothetical protein